ncbi:MULTISPECIES: hypothetical protein [unclassified Mycobacterium]|uniref:hypothetical protein n=1 Tax=unclassified Mycobacterium TaxID=2642494 RepID=UPI0007FD5062|nr:MULTISPECIES: hypothetical protein [unclassified Mycobacterium]OBG53921.1 hypothetical protein A5704_26655 [Mycobacterium sp. E735]OBG68471.1 hypothetical protein A5703_10640 [Mycobacterium sp. E188]OBG91189.1 hypothetical protein A9X05_11945 [Mycobacterium sp. E3298]OBH32892.1 hypothetical protein A5691_11745 [Mycobacterium sp. E183]
MTQFPPPQRRGRATADTVATVLLFVVQLVVSAGAFALALLSSMWLMLPICSDNCDSPGVTHFVHRTFAGTVVIVAGIAVGLLVSCVGALVAGARRRPGMWKWPALGLVMALGSVLIAAGLWVN